MTNTMNRGEKINKQEKLPQKEVMPAGKMAQGFF